MILSMRFVAFDLETTGTLPGVDRIVEIGAVRLIDGEVDAIFSTLVDPERPMPEGATRVNGITDDMLVGKPKIEACLGPLSEFCGDDLMVAHNAAFDYGFLLSEYRRHDCATPRGLVMCSFLLAKKMFPGVGQLQTLDAGAAPVDRGGRISPRRRRRHLLRSVVFKNRRTHDRVAPAVPAAPKLDRADGERRDPFSADRAAAEATQPSRFTLAYVP